MLSKQTTSTGKFVNITNGNLVIKNKAGDPELFASITGTIYKIEFIEDEYNGKRYEKAKIFIKSDENYILQIRTDSGYFRGFCNSLKSGNPTKELTIIPNSKVENGKSQTTIFISQDGKFLKHFFTKDFNGELPKLEKVEFKGVVHYDNSKQIEYWKNWLLCNYENLQEPELTPAKPETLVENEDDLPF
jgi:hypothetical protein